MKAVKIRSELDTFFPAITQNQAISDQCQVIILSSLAKAVRMLKVGFTARKPSYLRILDNAADFYFEDFNKLEVEGKVSLEVYFDGADKT
ncbi:hypothetical protein [Terasakiella pusilla]|uniref:hypothetical protein n=1 Tax=Terasakiella pusilla TaxID=64973 RepID=UPI00048C552F|nr:hypothetical protein [Terasakiella pusilla]